MRTMLKISIPTGTGNEGVKDGSLPKTLASLQEDLHPEAAYFYPEIGKRTAMFVFDMKEASQLAEIGERLWASLGAEFTVFPVMNSADLKAGLEKSAKTVSRTSAAA
jgi:hypothetical protein